MILKESMTLSRFNKLLKLVHPSLRIRQRSFGDIGGIFVGLSGKAGYIARITKGELTLNGYRMMKVDPTNPLLMKQGKIQKRGRKTLINILRNYRWVKTHQQRTMLTLGIIPKEYGQ